MVCRVPTRPQTALPRPEDRPTADVVIYDGDCPMCCDLAQRLARWDRGGRLALLAANDAEVPRRFPQLDAARLREEMVVIDRRGRVRGGAEAVRYLTRRVPRLMPLAPLLHLPLSLPLWRWVYRQVARRRPCAVPAEPPAG